MRLFRRRQKKSPFVQKIVKKVLCRRVILCYNIIIMKTNANEAYDFEAKLY